MGETALTVHYDGRFDVLEIFFQDPEPALTIELSDDVYVHIVPETRQAIGLTVHHFRKNHPHVAVPFRGALVPVSPEVARAIATTLLDNSHAS